MGMADHHGSYRIESLDTYIRIRFEPEVLITPELIYAVLEKEFKLPRSSAVNDLWDLRGSLPSDDLNYDAIAAIIDFIKDRYQADSPHQRTAVVADQSASYGMARMFESLAHKLPYEVRIFSSEDDALAWLQS